MNFPANSSVARVHAVRMGEMAASKSPDDLLRIVGLGSCVALVLLARERRAVAMAHIVLPESQMAGGREAPPAKFADTAVPAMLEALRSLRVKPGDLDAVVVGGAMMFGTRPGSKLAGVGDRNVNAVLEVLERHGIPVTGQDVGGKKGRSIQVSVGECRVFTKSGLEELLEVGGPPLQNADEGLRRIGVRPVLEPFPDAIWTSPAEGGVRA